MSIRRVGWSMVCSHRCRIAVVRHSLPLSLFRSAMFRLRNFWGGARNRSILRQENFTAVTRSSSSNRSWNLQIAACDSVVTSTIWHSHQMIRWLIYGWRFPKSETGRRSGNQNRGGESFAGQRIAHVFAKRRRIERNLERETSGRGRTREILVARRFFANQVECGPPTRPARTWSAIAAVGGARQSSVAAGDPGLSTDCRPGRSRKKSRPSRSTR